jgi:hypothetical protein
MPGRNWLHPLIGGRRGTARHIDIEPGRHFTAVHLDRS